MAAVQPLPLVSADSPGEVLERVIDPAELAATLGWSTEAALALITDTVELRWRLPRLWELTVECRVVPVRVARQIAECTTDLSAEAVRDADRMVCADPRRVGAVRARRLVDEVRLWHDPGRAVDDEQQALAGRDVWSLSGTAPATTELRLLLDTPDAQHFEDTVARVARALGTLGDTDPLEIRRARAAGVLAGPRLALDLLAGRGREAGDPGPGAPAAQLYLHISPRMSGESVLTGGPVEVERLGVATRELIAAWLSGATVTVRPVLDLARDDTVDTHDPPSWMHEVVILRDGHCVFPECRRSARRCDLDHIRPYVAPDEGGPPGQTSPDNLAPLCRRHHRAKTHGAFDYERRPDGSYCWTLPTGRQVLAYPVR